jgi:hypothetical protein
VNGDRGGAGLCRILFTNAQTYVEDREKRASPDRALAIIGSPGIGRKVTVRMADLHVSRSQEKNALL